MFSDDDSSEIEIANYFRSNLIKFHQAVDPVDYKRFSSLDNNGDRVAFVLSYPEAHLLPLDVEDCPVKELKKANSLKETGNMFYKHGDFLKALETYSNAVLITPRKELGILLANRAAALYNLELFDLALSDADEAFRIGYPKELFYKLEERRARCFLGLKNHLKAITSFRCALQALDDAKIPLERKKKIESDIRVMLAFMEKGQQVQEIAKKKNPQSQQIPVLKNSEENLQKITDVNPLYPSCSSAVEIRNSGGSIGRHAIATRDIMPGELLIVDKPFCAVLLGEHRLINCQYCFKKNIAPYPAACDTCAIVAYCSVKCRDLDAKAHVHECDILGPLWLSNASITCLLALKAITQKSYAKFKNLENIIIEKSQGTFEFSKEKPYKSKDYMAFRTLITHEDERTSEDLMHRAYMAAWLLRVLKKSNYLPEDVKSPDTAEANLTEDEKFFGGMLLHHLQLMQFNTHEISELVKRKNDITLQRAKSNFIAGGLYPTAALLNHSCIGGIVRYFVGTTMIVRAIRTISKGSEICDNYGPFFTTEAKSERQRKLRLKYWFNCNCEACNQQWPLLENIDPTILRFKCETGESCGNILLVNINSMEFMIPCSKCRKSTNIMKGLKALQDTDALFKVASNHLEDGNHNLALKAYLDILKLFDENLALPIRDYHLAQQGARLCMLPLGNTIIL